MQITKQEFDEMAIVLRNTFLKYMEIKGWIKFDVPFDPAVNDSIKDMEEEEKAFPPDKE